MEELLAVSFGYVVGSMPFAFVLASRRGVDLRTAGSGNVGATNVLRTAGVPAAAAALLLDGGKGALVVLVAQQLASEPATAVAAGVAAVIGHVYPVWLRFHGGKGVATAAGTFGLLSPPALAAGAVVFLLCVWMTRYMSVGSVAGAVVMALVAAVEATPAVGTGAVLTAAIVIHRHRGNLERLVAGTERRVGQRSF